ncbi:MAG TPA: copper resistance protein CopC [Candidatus Dormibacteraeota bacterium]|nr:copper resistance protein CopC [Candidatus Dormibacteraeota bacterium]
MARRWLRVGLVAAALALALAAAQAVSAHALLASADPSADAILSSSPAAVTLTFTETPDARLSSVQVLDASGGSRAQGKAEAVPGQPTELRVQVAALPDGVYTVAWRTVSSVDGHAAAGSFAFSIGVAPAPVTAGASVESSSGVASTSAGSIAAHWILYVGLIGLLGAALAGELSGSPGVPRRLAVVSSLLGLVGAGLLVAAQATDAGVALADLPGTSLGVDAIARLAPLALAAIALGIPVGHATARVRFAGALAGVAMLVDAVVSHASSAGLAPLQIAAAWLHLVAVAAWLGTLAGILLELRGPASGDKASTVRRFSRWAGLAVAAVALTGVARAAGELRAPSDLLTTDYGRLIVAKTVVLAVVSAVAALNHFRNVPAGLAGLGAVRRAGSLELLGGALLLVLASTLVNVPPPIEAASGPPAPPGIVADASDFATTVRLRLVVTPGSAGQDTFRATVTDYDSGEAVQAKAVVLRFTYPSRPGIGASTLTLAPAGDGTFAGSGANLSLGGGWSISALVEETVPVEVPVAIRVPLPQLPVDVARVAGAPTIYTAHLPGSRAVQLYLDPQPNGTTYLHVTFFDANGKELAVTNVDASVALDGGSSQPLALSPLEPGHVVGHLLTHPSTVAVSVAATAPTGEPIEADLKMTP